MAHNTGLSVQEALVRAANKLGPADLEEVIKEAETELSLFGGINRTWAKESLESRGFEVAELPEQTVRNKR